MLRVAFLTLLLASLAPLGTMASVLQQNNVPAEPVRTAESWEWKDCGDESFIVAISSIKVSPDPPQKGQNLTITVAGSVAEQIEEGAYADVAVKIGLIKILEREVDVCEEARNANATVQCPVKEGDYNVEQTVALPKEIPPGKFKVELRAYTVDDEDLACVNIDVDFRKKFPHLW